MTARVKICGITAAEDALMAARAGADALGFVLAPSPRQIPLETAARIARLLPPFVARVAVMVDPTRREVLAVIRTGAFTQLQLHGAETAGFCSRLGFPVCKAFKMTEPADLAELEAFAGRAPGVSVLVDWKDGGSGRACDWKLARRAARRYPLVLAGGLTPENVAEAVRTVGPWAVDVSGGVERSPGRKDPSKVRRFIEAAKEKQPRPCP